MGRRRRCPPPRCGCVLLLQEEEGCCCWWWWCHGCQGKQWRTVNRMPVSPSRLCCSCLEPSNEVYIRPTSALGQAPVLVNTAFCFNLKRIERNKAIKGSCFKK